MRVSPYDRLRVRVAVDELVIDAITRRAGRGIGRKHPAACQGNERHRRAKVDTARPAREPAPVCGGARLRHEDGASNLLPLAAARRKGHGRTAEDDEGDGIARVDRD